MIRALQTDDINACASLLATVPEWFGIENANAAYIASLYRLPAFVAVEGSDVVGFAAVERFGTEPAAEMTVIVVERSRHRSGIGRELVAAVEQWCRDHEIEWIHVKTLGPSTPDEGYAKTRQFYRALGYVPIYESLTEWGTHENAALIQVKHLQCDAV
jgi:N-acetylglutamate synthase-like GNAT family acetyltransferase